MRHLRFPILGIDKVWIVTVIAGVFIFVNTLPIRPHDFWWHLALGREIVSTLNIPTVDIYSHTMYGTPYPSYNMFWFADVGLYSIYRSAGLAGVVFFQSLLITASYGLLAWLCWKESNNLRVAAAAIIFAAALGINNWNVRPQSISYLIGILFLYAIYSYKKQTRLRFLLIFPMGMLIWVNSHGSFIIGIVLLGIWVVEVAWEKLAAKYHDRDIQVMTSLIPVIGTFLISLFVCFINPRGIGIIDYVQSISGNPEIRNLVAEWAPPNFNSTSGSIFICGYILSAIVLAMSHKRPNFSQIAKFVMFGLLGFMAIRSSIWYGIVMAPVIAFHLPNLFEQNQKEKMNQKQFTFFPLLNYTILFFLFIGMVISLPWFKKNIPLPGRKSELISNETPIAATNYLIKESPPENLFNEMGFGSYLIWAAEGKMKVFTDTRIELYPAEIWEDYLSLSNSSPDWEITASKYDINTMMLSKEHQQELIKELSESPLWRELYEDDLTSIFTRKQEHSSD